MAATVILVEAQPRRASDGAAGTVRLAGGGAKFPYDYGGVHWSGGITGLPRSIGSLDFEGDQPGGGGVSQALALEWAPGTNAALDTLASLIWTDAPIAVRIGPENGDRALPPIVTGGKVLDASVEGGMLRIALADDTADLKRPLLVDRFAGTGGIEGPIEWDGMLKPRAWGRCFNVVGRPIDTANNIWCLADPSRPWHAIDEVRDMGVATEQLGVLGWQGSAAATFAALQAAAAPAGGGIACPSIACVKWWTEPSGDLRADIRGESAGGYIESAPDIVARIAAARSALGFAPGTIAAAVAARPMPFGYFEDQETASAADAISEILGDVSISWPVVDGVIHLRPWDWTPPVIEAASVDVRRTKLHKPVGTRRLGYRRNQAPMARGDLAAIVLSRDVVYEDGTPLEDLRPAEGGATKGAVIGENISLPGEATPLPREELVTSEGTSADTNAVGSRPSAELLAQIDQAREDLAAVPGTVAQINTTIATLTTNVNGRVDQVDGRVDLTVQRQSAAERASRQLDRQLADIGKSLLRVAVEADRTRATFRDAGIHVDPDNGEVRIEAIEQTAERVAQAQLRLTAAEAAIQLRVTAAYVNQKITEAVLDPSQIAELEEVFLRITAAEQTLDALNASIVTKADAQTLTNLGLVVTDVTNTIDALNGLIQSKAETSTVDALGTRVGAVETTLDSLGDVVGVSTEIRQVRYAVGLTGKALLEAIVAGDELKRGQVQSQASIQSQLTTTINDKVGSEAAARQALAVEVGEAKADMVDERAVRAAADRAEAAARVALGLQFGQANADVLDRIDVLVQADSSQVERANQIAAAVGEQASDITEIRELNIDRDRSIAGITTALRQSRAIGSDTAHSLLSTIVAADEAKRQSLVARSNLFSQVTSEITEQGEVKTRELRRLEALLTGVDSALKAAVTSLNQAIVNGDGAQASALQSVAAALETVQGDLNAAVTRLDQANVDQDTATSESLFLVSAAIATLDGDIDAAVTELKKAIVDGDSAQASALEEVSTSLGNLQGSVQTLAQTVIEQGNKVRSFLESSVTAGGSTALVRIWAEQSPGVRASGIDLQADFITLGQRRALEITPNGIRANVNLAAGARFTLGVGVGWEVATKPRTFEASDGETIAFGLTFSSPPGYLPIVPTGLAPLGDGESYSLTLDPISGSQAVARLKILIPGTPSAQEIIDDYAGTSGPTRQIDKDARPDSTNGSYRIVGQVDVNQYMIGADNGGQVITQPEIGGRGWNETSVTITLWALLDGVWGEVGQFADFRNEYYEFSGSYSVPFFFDQFVNVSSGATKFGMTASSTGQSNTLDIIRIKWTAPGTSSGVRSATPDGQKAQVTITP